jgi:hypothetical protein
MTTASRSEAGTAVKPSAEPDAAACAVEPVGSVVNVVCAVARNARRRYRPVVDERPRVTGLAGQTLVGAVEHEVGVAIVIEAPQRPAGRVVTSAAGAAERLGVDVVFLVAVDARHRRVRVGRRQVALLARHHAVQTDQREASHVVIETHAVTPARLAVAGLAARAQLAAMSVIGAMTAAAVARQRVLEPRSGVAGLAVDLGMARAQREIGSLVVIELRPIPARGIVAISAPGSAPTAMHVVHPVTVVARRRSPLEPLVGVARPARRFGMSGDETEAGGVVVEPGLRPRRHVVTARAVCAERAPMRIIGGMTVVACGWSIAKLLAAAVAVSALGAAVRACEHEVGSVVRKRVAIQPYDVGTAPSVLGVTTPTLRTVGSRKPSVVTVLAFHVRPHLVVALETQAAFRLLAKRLVTLSTVVLDVGVSGGNRPRHDQSLE